MSISQNPVGSVEDPAYPLPLRVLCVDGGGMRGIYTAAYLASLANGFSNKRGGGSLDIGAGFNLIVGTSTGAIVGCAVTVGIPPTDIVKLYRDYGKAIFPRKMPNGVDRHLLADLYKRPKALKEGEAALRKALENCFGDITLAELYAKRRIALAIPAVNMTNHRSYVFKTPHIPTTNHRDDHYKLVDVCLATTAAPLFRSLARMADPGDLGGIQMFADGGLWANNPVLVGMIDALHMAAEHQPVEIFCLGTCPRPAGDDTSKINPHRGLIEWRFGGEAAKLAIDSQEFAYDHMARLLARFVNRPCTVVRFPSEQVPSTLMSYLDLDDASEEAANALIHQATTDASMTNSRCADPNDYEGSMVNRLFMQMPIVKEQSKAAD
jgi:uncharacterized protein